MADRAWSNGGGQRVPRGNNGSGDGASSDPVELILYVRDGSPKCAEAIANITSVLTRFRASRVRLTICDLAKNPGAGSADSVAITPTLVKRSPGPKTFILGHISPDVLVEILQAAGEDML